MENQNFSIKTLHKLKRLCYNGIMLKTKTKVKISVAGLMLAVSAFLFNFPENNALAEPCTTSPCNTTFEVNVVESLSVSITTPTEWASGDIDEFLRNKITLAVSTNSASGFSAYMRSKTSTNLTNAVSSSIILPTLASSNSKSNFAANHWGYTLGTPSYNGITYGETADITSNGTYYPMSTSDIKILNNGVDNNTRDVYFGAKANSSQASGTYLGTVIFSVTTSTPPAPTPTPPPVNPDDDTPNDGDATYDVANDRTVYTTIASSGSTTTTTTQVSSGDTTNMYQDPHVEIRRTEANVSDGSQVATGLAIAASTAAAGGMVFFILAKRREDEEEDEEELQ